MENAPPQKINYGKKLPDQNRFRRKKSNELSIGEAIEIFLDQCGLREVMLINRIRYEWASVVGEQIATATDEVTHRNGIFTVKLRTPNWKNELLYRRAEIKEAINTFAGQEVCKEVWIA